MPISINFKMLPVILLPLKNLDCFRSQLICYVLLKTATLWIFKRKASSCNKSVFWWEGLLKNRNFRGKLFTSNNYYYCLHCQTSVTLCTYHHKLLPMKPPATYTCKGSHLHSPLVIGPPTCKQKNTSNDIIIRSSRY